MNPATYRYQTFLGKISKVNGFNGSVSVKLEKSFIENIPAMESVFLEIDGKPVPFFISSSEYAGGDILKLKFEGYNSYEKVFDFVGNKIFLATIHENYIPDHKPVSISGYSVLSQDNNLIGSVTEIIQNPGHDLLKVVSPDKKEILIPYHEDFIIRLDDRGKTILVKLPEGLTEINV